MQCPFRYPGAFKRHEAVRYGPNLPETGTFLEQQLDRRL